MPLEGRGSELQAGSGIAQNPPVPLVVTACQVVPGSILAFHTLRAAHIRLTGWQRKVRAKGPPPVAAP